MTLAAGRLPMELVEVPALLVTLAAAIVLATAVLESARAPGAARRLLAERADLALELLLAAGLLRLAALDSLEAYAMVATIIAVRQLIGRGIQAVAAPGDAAAAAAGAPTAR